MPQDEFPQQPPHETVPDHDSDPELASTASQPKADGLENREVRAADPELSPRTNERLTEELQEALGESHVSVPVDRPHASAGQRAEREGVAAQALFTFNGLVALMGASSFVVIAAVVALTLNSWWLLPLAIAVLAAAVVGVVVVVLRVTREVEHPSPSLAAAMSADGVINPDHRFSEMIEEFVPPQADAAADKNERRTTPQENPGRASVEQAEAMTATSQESKSHPTPDR